jgi:hypothetical protein
MAVDSADVMVGGKVYCLVVSMEYRMAALKG